MEPSGPGRTPGVASRSSRQRATESTADFVSRLQGSIEELEVCEEVQQHPQARRSPATGIPLLLWLTEQNLNLAAECRR
jgi:hypothetical protein